MTDAPQLSKVVDGGFCIGCGACAALDPAIRIRRDEAGRLVAALPENRAPSAAAEASCPFAEGVPDENALSAQLFTVPEVQRDPRLGAHLATYAGWVEEGELRARGSSGGMATWILAELLRKGLVDAVLQVAELPRAPGEAGDGPLFGFRISQTEADVYDAAKTRYYPVEMSGVLSHMMDTPGRYAVVGVPCFIKAVRLAARQSDVLAERLVFALGIVCGHLKSAAFADSLAWQVGILPGRLENIDFRAKLEGRPASRYGMTVTGTRDGRPLTVTRPMEGLVGANWGHGLFKYKACEFCDDVFAETADAVVGDAWLPQYDRDHLGTNVAVVRRPELLALLREGAAAGRLHLEDLSVDAAAASQAGGLRHRRDGLAYRLWLADRIGTWRPPKRVSPSNTHLTPKLRRIHELRYALGQESHAAFLAARRSGHFKDFLAHIQPLIHRYDAEQNRSLLRRVLGFAKRKLMDLARPATAGPRAAATPHRNRSR